MKYKKDVYKGMFTAYLRKAVIRYRSRYLREQYRRKYMDQGCLFYCEKGTVGDNHQRFLQNDALEAVLNQLTEREKTVLLKHILGEISYQVLADDLNLRYKGVAAIYYRALAKVRRAMEEKNEI